MELRHVLFIGGDADRFASVKVRCIDVASRLGCDYVLNTHFAADIPDHYSLFVCIKPAFFPGELAHLASRGRIVWDIIDTPPPRSGISLYLASTAMVREIFHEMGRIAVIPHHHCNFEERPNHPGLRRPAWIGSRHWRPVFKGFEHDWYDTDAMGRDQIVQCHRRAGIGLNFRHPCPSVISARDRKYAYQFHVAVNSGIKLINCIGFGTPSVSANEPAYHEIGAECTVFSSLKNCAKWVRELQNNPDLYRTLRKACLRKRAKFHVDSIIKKYKSLLMSI